MLKDKRNLLWILPLTVILTLPLWKSLAVDFLKPEREESPPPIINQEKPGVLSNTEMDRVRFEQSRQDGTKEWYLTASRIYSTEKKSDMAFEDVKAFFFGASGDNEEARIRSRKANYNSDTQKLTLQQKVVVQNQKGYEIQTDSLEYVAADKKIKTTSPVTVKGDNIEVSGKSLLYDMVTGNYSLTGNVVCRIW